MNLFQTKLTHFWKNDSQKQRKDSKEIDKHSNSNQIAKNHQEKNSFVQFQKYFQDQNNQRQLKNKLKSLVQNLVDKKARQRNNYFQFQQAFQQLKAQSSKMQAQQPIKQKEDEGEQQNTPEQPEEMDEEESSQQELTIQEMIIKKVNVENCQIRYMNGFQFLFQTKNGSYWVSSNQIMKLNPQWLQNYYSYWL